MQLSVLSTLIVVALACVPLAAQPDVQSRPDRPTAGTPPQGPVTGPRDRPPAEESTTGTARISGRVVGGEAWRPLRRAIIRLLGESLKEGRSTTTDEQGHFEVKDLPAGRFHVSASKGGYVTMAYGQNRPFQSGRPIELTNGGRIENVNFNLPGGSVIAGRITDEFGEPVAHVGVQVLRYSYAEGRRQLMPVGGTELMI